MSAVVILTPIVIASWPAIAAAVASAAASMGFAVQAESLVAEDRRRRLSVETEIENSEVVSEGLTAGQELSIHKDGVTITFRRDTRGRCTVCASGEGRTERELRQIAEQAAGRVVQQFIYHKLLTELKQRKYTVVGQEVLADQSVRVRLRL